MTEDEIERIVALDLDSVRRWDPDLHAWGVERVRRYAHPKIDGLPDYGLRSLSEETERYCRSLCLDAKMRYEELKERFAAGHQVIQARRSSSLVTELARKGVCPINFLDSHFKVYIQASVEARQSYERERAGKLRAELSGRTMETCATESTALRATS